MYEIILEYKYAAHIGKMFIIEHFPSNTNCFMVVMVMEFIIEMMI